MGLPTVALGIDGVTQCTGTSTMPATIIQGANTFVVLGATIYSFGGKLASNGQKGVVAIYKYDMNTDSWTQTSSMIQPRFSSRAVQLSENEIFVTGI